MEFSVPTTLQELIAVVLRHTPEGSSRDDYLLNGVMRPCHFWPALQMKKFYDRSGLVLLHNTYKRIDVDAFAALYNECRSVVLDLVAPEGQNVVVSLAHSIPERLTDEQYAGMCEDGDRVEMSYEGTVVTVYEHGGVWHFGTTGCPSVDRSRYRHPTKTHGQMMDEALRKLFPDAVDVRKEFTDLLDKEKSYSFIIVHHENRHVTNYAEQFGAEYAVLVHIATRARVDNSEEDVAMTKPLAELGVRYAEVLQSPREAIEHIRSDPNCYGIIVKRDGRLMKVSVERVIQREEADLGNPNKWYNMLWVYKQNKPHYQIQHYVAEYAPDLEVPKDSMGRDMAPTYIIHTVICTMRDILYQLYVNTTQYFPKYGRFKMDRDVDAVLAPMLRFHLAEMRHLQVTYHKHGLLTPKAVYHYLCHIQTMKNLRSLIRFFAYNPSYAMTPRQAECFSVLERLMSDA
jgi:hypothetical protein